MIALAEITEHAKNHPLTWSALWAALVGLGTAAAGIGGFVLWVNTTMDDRYEARDRSIDRPALTLRQEMLIDVGVIKLAIQKTVDDDKAARSDLNRQLAWNLVATINNNVGGLRGRVNECDVRQNAKGGLTRMEHDVCVDYRAQLKDAEDRYKRAWDDAQKLSRSQ